jgi:DNA-binding SARP family transcriptional activator
MAFLALLWRFRPEWPELPNSLSSPVTTAMLQQLALVAAWFLGVLVILLLLANSLRVLTRSPRAPGRALRPGVAPGPRDRSLGQARLAAGSAQAAFPPPFPLILRGRPETSGELAHAPAPARERVVAATAQTVEADEPVAARTPGAPRRYLSPPSIALLGPLEIATSKPRRRGLRSQTQQLLAYLALHAEGATTDDLVAALWPDVDGDKARKRLWRSVSEARAQLGESIHRASERYLLDRQAVAVDLDQFEELLATAHAHRGDDREQLLERALALVRGQPLAGTDYPWAAGDMRRLRATIVDLLEQLGYLRLDEGNATGALAAAEQAIAFDAYNEAAHQLAMRAEATLGLRKAIVERYEQLCQELDGRFGLDPERETRLLYRRLLSQDASS